MKQSSTILVSALALAAVTACGGGGDQPTSNAAVAAVAAASPPPAAARAVTIPGSDRPSTIAAPAAETSRLANLDSVPPVDPVLAQRLRAELDRIEGALRQIDDSKIEKHEALEVVSDARAELDRERPNKFRLRSLLSGLAQGAHGLDVKGAGGFLSRLIPWV